MWIVQRDVLLEVAADFLDVPHIGDAPARGSALIQAVEGPSCLANDEKQPIVGAASDEIRTRVRVEGVHAELIGQRDRSVALSRGWTTRKINAGRDVLGRQRGHAVLHGARGVTKPRCQRGLHPGTPRADAGDVGGLHTELRQTSTQPGQVRSQNLQRRRPLPPNVRMDRDALPEPEGLRHDVVAVHASAFDKRPIQFEGEYRAGRMGLGR